MVINPSAAMACTPLEISRRSTRGPSFRKKALCSRRDDRVMEDRGADERRFERPSRCSLAQGILTRLGDLAALPAIVLRAQARLCRSCSPWAVAAPLPGTMSRPNSIAPSCPAPDLAVLKNVSGLTAESPDR
jgi:hypothetical protein